MAWLKNGGYVEDGKCKEHAGMEDAGGLWCQDEDGGWTVHLFVEDDDPDPDFFAYVMRNPDGWYACIDYDYIHHFYCNRKYEGMSVGPFNTEYDAMGWVDTWM